MADSDAERAAIRAAMQRLLDGTPKRSTGALSILQLAAEAGIKRWVLTHKHTDLADEFRSRVDALGPIPAAYSNLERQARDAQEANQELRAQNTQLRAQISAYARTIHELHSALANGTAPPRLSVVQRDDRG
jgi:chromosome segregation ATPase